ncbi:MAG: lactonase family protein [Spirochaetaceae bacterium]|jgi:6-phosphogluconolactonase|nr:lactonase family protein [Spirochaetaceae bacterium]
MANELFSFFIGTYADAIYALDGSLQSDTLPSTPTANPSYLALDTERQFLYAANELEAGTVSAFRVKSDNTLELLNSVSSMGAYPCHLFLGKGPLAGRLFATNYGSGNLAAYHIKDDGSLEEAFQTVQLQGSGPNKERQEGPHAHSIWASPDMQYLYLCNLGTDEIVCFAAKPTAQGIKLEEKHKIKVLPGSGPRHGVFSAEGSFFYVINEMGNTIDAFRYKPDDGSLTPLQQIDALPKGTSDETRAKSTGAAIKLSGDGNYLYASIRIEGEEGLLVCCTVDTNTGMLSRPQWTKSHGQGPRDICLSPNNALLYAAQQYSDTIAIFDRDITSGTLSYSHDISVPKPVCMVF